MTMDNSLLSLFCVALLLAACTQGIAPTHQYNATCITNTSVYIVRGSSLSGLVAPGTRVDVLEGYLRCNNLSRGDLVLYNFTGDSVPLIKVVKAVPGDHWFLNGSTIVVNNKTLMNSEGTPYSIGDTRRLALYTHDYPIIPTNTYLLMGNLAGGSLDSSVFGLVDKGDIIGRVLPER